MTRRPGKAPAQASSPRTHLQRHLHLTNTIHVRNHVHMQRKEHNRMLDPRRTPQLPLRRELTAVKKVKSLQDPSTSSNSFSPMSAGSSIARYECRAGDRAHLDEILQSQERARRPPRRSKGREGTEELDDRQRGSGNGISRGENLRKSQHYDESRGRRRDEYRNAATTNWSAAGYRVEERWHGDAEEIARRLIAEQKGSISSPAHSYMASLARAHGLSLLGFRDEITTSEAEGSFLESEDGEAGLMAAEYLSNSAGSPLVMRGHRNRRRGNAYGNGNGSSHLRVGIHNRDRKAVHGYKEAPVVPTMTDELDVSDIPQNGCGMPWYKSSSAVKIKSKSLLDYACAIPDAVAKKKTGDSKQVSRNSSRHGSKRDHQVPDDHSAIPLLNRSEGPNDEGEEAPAREARGASIPQSREKSPCRAEEAVSNAHRSSVISHKYRPRSFKDIVGQSLVVKSLTTAITKGKVAPVYVFAGPHGTGKTSCARVFAAALVCLNTEPHRRPCGLCRECATITLNRSRDVKEIDVGSCSDLDQLKSLLNLSSPNALQRVLIVKGCDLLSNELWNSFLKFLDNIPRNVVFILIVTDLERLPSSATSRCQRYHFGKLKESEIVNRLQVIAERERLDVDEEALFLIASRANGSLRDAEAMLDQLSLLDQTITLSMVQELSGLIPDEKLVNLLDMALAADTVHTVKGMRELLDAGVDALSLVAQLASLITNILAGTYVLRRESRKKGFFRRNMPRREEQQRLRQALKVLAECEKQLRASNDRPTWLTAALLQFAPDRSYLPSSVDTSMAPSPIAFDNFERVPPGESCTPRLTSPKAAANERKHFQRSSPANVHAVASRLQGEIEKDKAPVSAPSSLEHKERGISSQPQPDVHPSAIEVTSDRGLGLRTPSSLVLFDASRVGNRDFRELPRRDMEHIWSKVLDGCRSNVLRQLLSSHGTLMALSVARDETFAVAHVEFGSAEHKARAERLRSSTCHAFQMALGCPVELKLSLECPPSVVLEEIKASHPEPLANEVQTQTVETSSHSEAQLRPRRNKPTSRQEMLTGLAARSRRLGDAQSGPHLESRGSVIDYKYCFPVSGSSRRHRSRRPSLSRAPSLETPGVKVRWKHPKFKGIANMERKNRKKEIQHRRNQVARCFQQSPLSEVEQQPQEPTVQGRKRGFFLRLVPCGRSIQTHGSPSRP